MAENIVNLVLEKVADPLVKEVVRLWRAEKQIEKVRRELDWIRAFLKDADKKQIQEERQKQWVREVREVAYWIEDVIDTFLCEIPQKKPGKTEVVKRLFGKTKKLPVIHNLVDQTNQILERLKEISENKERFGINSLGEGSGGVRKLPVRPPVLPDIEDLDVVGFDAHRDNIVNQLLDETNPSLCVVSIVGPGGLGKTTLAKKVYNSYEVKGAYNIRIWVTISQEYKLTDVLKKILEKLERINESEQGENKEYFLTKLNKSLKEKKYLLITDDVWTSDLWMDIGKILPNDKNGSRILMTTRNFSVAKKADPKQKPYELNFLTEESSRELLLKKALPNLEIQNECPKELTDLAQQFVKKCAGLPLALVVLGSLLAQKEPTHSIWSKMMQTMSWNVDEQKNCTEIISTSFDDLPLALKSCFMYFAAFPEDYEIDAQTLLQVWIAEGFILHEENKTLEDTAERFLEELAKRSMVQVTSRFPNDDSIQRCHIHDLLRDVAVQKAKEDNFLTVYSNKDEEQDCGGSRRVAVHNSNGNRLTKYQSPNLRMLSVFNSPLPDCSGHKLLKVLNVHNHKRYDQLESLEGLSQLKYFHLQGRQAAWNQEYFEKLLRNMKFLQTIELKVSGSFELDCIWRIKTLRHVWIIGGILGPPSSTDLKNLQTLHLMKTRESWKPTTVPNMPNLRQLTLTITKGFPLESLVAFLNTLKKLKGLIINGFHENGIPIEVVDMREFSFYQHLTLLSFVGKFFCHGRKMAFETIMFPTHLTQLSFSKGSGLQQDHLVVLEKLQSLKSLRLETAYPNQTMRCSAGGFPCLQYLEIVNEDLEEWEIEEGAMPMLKRLHIYNCPRLRVPQGLQHLTALHELEWDLHEFDGAKENEIRDICKHVHSITICFYN